MLRLATGVELRIRIVRLWAPGTDLDAASTTSRGSQRWSDRSAPWTQAVLVQTDGRRRRAHHAQAHLRALTLSSCSRARLAPLRAGRFSPEEPRAAETPADRIEVRFAAKQTRWRADHVEQLDPGTRPRLVRHGVDHPAPRESKRALVLLAPPPTFVCVEPAFNGLFGGVDDLGQRKARSMREDQD